ncbi:TetR/AcrR family transcriptional regulator [Kribbella sp. NPDC058245]|uniref:TetR/AcrR family transcriptional regulator n=1 Tax=Kribbella sp. NPDC058245 TaxID=3346399 RepID=UPI0036EE3EDB
MESPRTRALQAAVELLGTEGLRSLTHARVDDRAGLPKGSASNYFRSRAALLSGVVDWLAEADRQAAGPAFRPATAAEFVDVMCGLFDLITRVNRVRTTARLILFLEGSHDPVLREALSRGHAALKAGVTEALASLGVADPAVAAQTVAAVSEGLILHRIARYDDDDPRPVFELIARAVIPGAG